MLDNGPAYFGGHAAVVRASDRGQFGVNLWRDLRMDLLGLTDCGSTIFLHADSMARVKAALPTVKGSRARFDATPLREAFFVREGLREDLDYRQNVAHVRWRQETPEAIARRYVRRAGAARDGFEALLRSEAWSQLPGAISARYPDTSRSRLTRSDHTATLEDGAQLLARRGAGRCLRCGSRLARDGNRRNFCGSHARLEPPWKRFEGAYEKPILRALEALRVLSETGG